MIYVYIVTQTPHCLDYYGLIESLKYLLKPNYFLQNCPFIFFLLFAPYLQMLIILHHLLKFLPETGNQEAQAGLELII